MVKIINQINTIICSKSKKSTIPIAIYTIGYQDLSIGSFINLLVDKGIKTVLDVRNNPFSYKYGFNSACLKKHLENVQIEYVNIPELGIEKKYRDNLEQNELWDYYSKVLENRKSYIEKALYILTKQPTVLMCYEKNPDDCHRLRLAKAIQDLVDLPIINYK